MSYYFWLGAEAETDDVMWADLDHAIALYSVRHRETPKRTIWQRLTALI